MCSFLPCNITSRDTHNLCIVCLGRTAHAVQGHGLRIHPPRVRAWCCSYPRWMCSPLRQDSSPHFLAYEELVEVITHTMTKLNIDWLAERQDVHPKSKLVSLHNHNLHSGACCFFFFFFLEEILTLFHQVPNYSNIRGLKEHGYGAITKVEQTLARYLSPDMASSLKAPTLPTRPCRTT